MYENHLGQAAESADVYAAPGTTTPERLRGFPPTLVLLSEVDGLRPSGEAFAALLRSAGVPVDVQLEPGTQHGHLNGADAAAVASRLRVARHLQTLREGDPA